MVSIEDEYIIISNKEEKIIFQTNRQLEAIRTIQMIWAADGDATLFKAVAVAVGEDKDD